MSSKFAPVLGLFKWESLLLLPDSELGRVTFIIAYLEYCAFLSWFISIGSDILRFLVAEKLVTSIGITMVFCSLCSGDYEIFFFVIDIYCQARVWFENCWLFKVLCELSISTSYALFSVSGKRPVQFF